MTSYYVNDSDCKLVNQAIEEAELETAAEIVPVIASQSDDYPRSCDLVGVWLGMLFMFFVWVALPEQQHEIGSWGGWSSGSKMFMLCLAMLTGFTIGTFLAYLIPPLRRGFTPRKDMQRAAQRRAREVFFDQRINHTAGGQGILFYISMFEETAVVLADQLIIETLTDETLEELTEQFTDLLQRTTPVDALIQIIEQTTELLAEELPREEDDEDELPNELILL